MTERPIHPACAMWPRPSDEVVLALAESIRTAGLHNPIWLMPDGAILDGKTRHEACGIAGVEPRFETYAGDEPVKFTIAQNRHRRHMEIGELSLIVAELCKLPQGRPKLKGLANPFNPGEDRTAAELAKEAGIGRSNVVSAKTVLQKGEANIIEMVRANKAGAQSAAFFVRNTPREQQRVATVDQVKGVREAHLPKGQKKRDIRVSRTVAVPYSDFEKLRPLIKRVKEQSKRHAATVSFVELSRIAFELDQLADAWMKNGAEPRTHSAPVPINSVRRGG